MHSPIAIPKAAAVVVDGKANDWPAQTPIITAFAEDAIPASSAADIDAAMRLAWNEDGLLVFVELHSTHNWIEAEDIIGGFTKDSIELFMRQGSAWKHLVQTVITPGFDPSYSKIRHTMWDYRRDDKYKDIPTAVICAAAKQADGGTIEVLIPWQQLIITPATGLELEFRANINKVIPGLGRRQLTWRRTDGDFFQKLVLADTSPNHNVDQAAWLIDDELPRIGIATRNGKIHGGKTLYVKQGKLNLSSAQISAGDEAHANLWLDRKAVDPAQALELYIDNTLIMQQKINDPIPGLLLSLERVFTRRYFRSNPDHMQRLGLIAPNLVDKGPLPEVRFNDERLAHTIGVQSLSTQWFDQDYNKVDSVTKTGRYGAEVTAKLADGRVLKTYHAALHAPEALLQKSAAALGITDPKQAAEFVNKGIADNGGLIEQLSAQVCGDTNYPDQAQHAWLHGLRKACDNEIVYVYNKRLPDGYDDDKEKLWPAIIYLHGSNGRLPSQQEDREKRRLGTIDRDLLGWSNGKGKPFAMYALISDGGWEPDAVLDTVDKILAEDRVDPDRIIIMGFSMGGMGTWRCVTRYPDRWAAAVPIGGRGSYAYLAERVKDKPIWVFNGDADRTTTLEQAMVIVDALKAINGDVRLTVFPGIGHGGSQNHTFETEGIWEWLEQQNRSNK